MEYSVVLLLGGKSTRFNSDINKTYFLIKNKPVFTYSLEKFLAEKECIKVVIVYNSLDFDILTRYLYDYKDKRIVTIQGGNERYQSVLKGLSLVESKYVLVHDGARPNITQDIVRKVVNALIEHTCVSVGYKLTDTIKKVTESSCSTISRDDLYCVQTPQGCNTELLKLCLNKIVEEDVITDDLMAVEKYSDVVPYIVITDKTNIKLTSKEDIELIKFYLGAD